MPASNDDLLQRLRATFRVEAQEHVQTIEAGLIALERGPAQAAREALETAFRAAHSLKGAARAVNVAAAESLCQSLESAFAALKRPGAAPSAELFDLLHRTRAALLQVLEALESPTVEPPGAGAIAQLRQALQAALSGVPARPAAPPAAAPEEATAASTAARRADGAAVRALPDSVRVGRRTLDKVLLQAEELLYAKAAAAQRAEALRALRQRPGAWLARSLQVRDDARAVEAALAGGAPAARAAWRRLRAHVDDSRDLAAALEADLLRHARQAEQDQRAVGALVDQLLNEMKQVMVQPFSTLLDLFPASVRELARDQGKDIELAVEGAEIAIDRRILDEIKDPLIHLVRNSVDHGIEPPDVRRARGKPARGRIALSVSQRNGSEVDIVLSDDGAGFDLDKLRQAAAQAGLASAPGSPSRESLIAMAFEPGVSTSPLITDLSGRGLGLSIAKEHVERLTGAITVDSQPGQGTAFRISLPVTLARLRGVVVRSGGQSFVLPTQRIERVARVPAGEVKTVEGRPMVPVGGRAVALVALSTVLGLPEAASAVGAAARVPVVLLQAGPAGQAIAFGVDEVLEEREVLVKPLGAQLERLRHIAGATVLGSGQVVPVLHVPDLLRQAVVAPPPLPARAPASAAAPKSVLVAEDSITSRTLLRGILEGAGYRVETAADGVDAFTALRSGQFDIVVSDVDMPRLNGFGLTARIRADKRLAELPVVLVTALDSREDREHGIDVGASAYIVKSGFERDSLLDVVRRLA